MLAKLAALRARVLMRKANVYPGRRSRTRCAPGCPVSGFQPCRCRGRDGGNIEAARQRRPTGERLAEQVMAWEEWEK